MPRPTSGNSIAKDMPSCERNCTSIQTEDITFCRLARAILYKQFQYCGYGPPWITATLYEKGVLLLPSVVYIVDDDVSFHTITRQQLQLAGYEVQVYSSAEQFLDQERDESRLGCLLVGARGAKRPGATSSTA